MALRARLTPPRELQTEWPWHEVNSSSIRSSLMVGGGRRMEAENFLACGFRTWQEIQSKSSGWTRLADVARTWQPSRLKGIQVSREFGTPFLAATQVYDVRPVPRKWLSLNRTSDHKERFVPQGTILLTCSGNVGRATLAHSTIDGTLISHDLLRLEANEHDWQGWIYAYLRAPTVREMMKSAQYGHIIKHLETHHMDELPVVRVDQKTRAEFGSATREILRMRDYAYAMTLEAEQQFTDGFGDIEVENLDETGFTVSASLTLATRRRRLDAWHHSPSGKAIVEHLSRQAIDFSSISDLGFEVWLPTRFRRIAADDGVFLFNSSDLFEINPDITKRIADEDFGDPYCGRVEQGWILLSRSGQIYGLNGSAMIPGRSHERKIVSDDVIRIAPKYPKCRAGYLLMAMTHPRLGRPRIKTLPYGSSIPHIEVEDVRDFAVPRLHYRQEAEIADRVEEAARLRDEADKLENELGARAEVIIADFLSQ